MSSAEVELSNQINVEETQEETQNVSKLLVDPETTIFIGNVAIEATEDDIKNIFKEEFGEDLTIDIPETPRQKPNGHVPQSKHALIQFSSKIDFDAIKEKYDLTQLKEREIHIKKARTSEELHAFAQRRFRHRGNFRGGAHRGNFRGGAHRGNGRGGHHRGNFRGGHRRGGFRGNNYHKKERIPLDQMERSRDTLYVNNVPFNTTKDMLAEFFGTKVENIVLPMRKLRNFRSGKIYESDKLNRGIAFITFEDLSDQEDGISKKVEEFNGKNLGDRTITVDVAVIKPEDIEKNESEAEEATGKEEDGEQEA